MTGHNGVECFVVLISIVVHELVCGPPCRVLSVFTRRSSVWLDFISLISLVHVES